MSKSEAKEPRKSLYEFDQEEEEQGSWIARWGPPIGLLLAVVIVVYVIFFTGHDYEVVAEFENASQLTVGNEVVINGANAGSVKSIELGPHGQALVRFSVTDEFAPLHRGTIATVRSYSLSGLANRQVQLTLPVPEREGDAIDDGATLDQSETVSEVDLDQVFDTLDDRTVRNLKKVIRGFEVSYDGVAEQANRGFHYLNPFLSTSSRLFAELNSDPQALGQLVVDVSRLSGALGSRAPDLTALVGNLNQMMSALASEKQALGTSVANLPDFLREANTTFVNLRSALDDLDPLVLAARPAAVRLQPFFAELRRASADAIPTVKNLDRVVSTPGSGNDLIDLTADQVPLEQAAIGSGSPDCGQNPVTDYAKAANGNFNEGAFGESVCSLRNGLPPLAFFRAYTTELVGWFDDFSHPNFQDANGAGGRIAIDFNTFSASPLDGLPFLGTGNILPTPLDDLTNLDLLTQGYVRKCPGANERPLGAVDPSDHSVPFYPDGSSPYTDPLNCDPTQVAPGP